MNKQTDNESLLADVLAPEADSGFRAALLAQTLHQARRRRRNRQLRRYGGGLAVVLAVTVFISNQILRRTLKSELVSSPQPKSYLLVLNQPLSSGQIVITQPLTPNQLVVSTATAQAVQTVVGVFREVDDDELMALASPQVVALVRRGPHETELIFVSSPPEDSDSRQN